MLTNNTGHNNNMRIRGFPSVGFTFSEYLAVTGLTLQLAAIYSNSWVVIERFVPEHCRSKKKLAIFTDPACFVVPFHRNEIARAGLWSVCYKFPHVEPAGHTDPYCSDFAEDNYQATGLTVTQMLCMLSVCFACFALGLLCFVRILRWKEITLSSAAFIFLAISGLCGIAGCIYCHSYLTKEYLVYYDPSLMISLKWWAFHAFLDGSVLNLTAWLMNGWRRKRFRLTK